MGITVTCRCRNCGYSAEVRMGWGLSGGRNLLPALNNTLNEVMAVDFNGILPDNSDIIPYTDLTLNKKPFFRNMPKDIEWGDYCLPMEYNFCPKCKKYKLSFQDTGPLWD